MCPKCLSSGSASLAYLVSHSTIQSVTCQFLFLFFFHLPCAVQEELFPTSFYSISRFCSCIIGLYCVHALRFCLLKLVPDRIYHMIFILGMYGESKGSWGKSQQYQITHHMCSCLCKQCVFTFDLAFIAVEAGLSVY